MTETDLRLIHDARTEMNASRLQRAQELVTRQLTAAIQTLVDPERSDKGPFLDPPKLFRHDHKLERFAMDYIDRMVRTKTYGHTDTEGNKVFGRLQKAGFPVRFCQENLAFGQPTAQWVNEAWMGSSMHRANILNPGYTYVGIATAMTGLAQAETWQNTNDLTNGAPRLIQVGNVRLWVAVFYTPTS
jgi:hypothetical protein